MKKSVTVEIRTRGVEFFSSNYNAGCRVRAAVIAAFVTWLFISLFLPSQSLAAAKIPSIRFFFHLTGFTGIPSIPRPVYF